MPRKWNEASLEAVQVGDNKIDVHYQRTETEVHIRVKQLTPGWKIILEPPLEEGTRMEVVQGALKGAGKAPIIVSTGEEVEVKLIKNK